VCWQKKTLRRNRVGMKDEVIMENDEWGVLIGLKDLKINY
jgi:hypothetical protein